jgi:glutathione S-transferase
MAITLYGITASRTFRSLWMLEELGLTYDHIKVDFSGTRKPDYLQINPNGHIPALRDGELVLFESMAINLYLAMQYGGATPAPSLWPESAEDRARAIQWSFWGMTEIEPSLFQVLINRVGKAPEDRDEPRAVAKIADLQPAFGVLNAALDGRPHLVGAAFSVADLNVAAILSWARYSKVDLGAFPHLAGWLKTNMTRPAFRKAFER